MISGGIAPVFSLHSRKVVPLTPVNLSNAAASRNANGRTPSRTAAAIPSRGMPENSRLWTQRALRTSPGENEPPAPGSSIRSSTSRSTYSGSTPALWATSCLVYPLTPSPIKLAFAVVLAAGLEREQLRVSR